MKKIILLFFALAFTINIFAQKDSLIVLNKDVNIVRNCSRVIEQDISFNIKLSIQFSKGAKFKAFNAPQNNLITAIRSDCGCSSDKVEQCYIANIYSYKDQGNTGVNYPKKLFLRYTKKKKNYTIEIPLNKILTTRYKHPGGNSLPDNPVDDPTVPKGTTGIKSSKSR